MTTPLSRTHPSLAQSRICPFLGMADDAQTALAFPSDWNCCHHCKPLGSIRLEHQRAFCLSRDHIKCSAYRQSPDQALPREFRSRFPVHTQAGDRVRKISLTLALFALLILSGYLFAGQIGSFLRTDILDPLLKPFSYPPPETVSTTPSPELSPSATPLPPSVTPTATQSSVFYSDGPLLATSAAVGATPTITRVPRDIETLIGLNHLFMIHRVKHGENLENLAHLYGTTVAAIFAVNYHFTTPLWVQQVIILPVYQTDVSDLPPFEPYRVTQDINLNDLATSLNADPEKIQYYNGLGTSEGLHAGEWIIIPREAAAPE